MTEENLQASPQRNESIANENSELETNQEKKEDT